MRLFVLFSLLFLSLCVLHPKQLLQQDEIMLDIGLGSPTQMFKLQIDTSSSFTWVPIDKAINSEASAETFDISASKTFLEGTLDLTISNPYGDVKGSTASDNLSYTNLNLPNFNFVAVDEISADFEDNFNGKLGLAYSNSLSDDYLFVKFLSKNKKIPNNLFSTTVDKATKLFNFDVGFLPVDYKPEDYSVCKVLPTESIPQDLSTAWNCGLSHYSIGPVSFDSATQVDGFVSFDSGSSFIIAPEFHLKAIKASLDPTCKVQSAPNMKYILCPKEIKAADFTLLIEGVGYTLPGETLLTPFGQDFNLYSVTFQDEYSAGWIVGVKFFRQFDFIFDYDKGTVRIKGQNKVDLTAEYNKYIKEKTVTELATKRFYLIAALGLISTLVLVVILCLCYRQSKQQNLLDQELEEQ